MGIEGQRLDEKTGYDFHIFINGAGTGKFDLI